ncbi:MAG TPA: D-Ala-D-Ala carboxypeptidase family metallohydrolase [Candidatus Hydrogenedens sp.]|nr:D-Ala-D-Ala carboxypeptidase family metallohydrolase [Candidatus Hydrogenedens sp.]
MNRNILRDNNEWNTINEKVSGIVIKETYKKLCVYRCPKNNTAANGARTSKHLSGKAFDYDQLSSLENWRVARCAFICNGNWEILLYYQQGSEEESIAFKNIFIPPLKPGDIPPENPPNDWIYTHGHVGI